VPDNTFWDIVLSPPVLLTFLVCLVAGAVIFWIYSRIQRIRQTRALSQQRRQQEDTIDRLLDSVTGDKEELVEEYEEQLRQRDDRIAQLETEVDRLRDRLTSSGVMGLFGGRQREVVSALLLENEQLHELLAQKQQQLRDLMTDMTDKLLQRLDEQAQESARAVRYKQALLSAFLQQEETRRLLNEMLAEGQLSPSQTQTPQLPQETGEDEETPPDTDARDRI
jgi:hypothetical protein